MNEGYVYFHWKPLWEAMNAHEYSCLGLLLRFSAGSVHGKLSAQKHISEKGIYNNSKDNWSGLHSFC